MNLLSLLLGIILLTLPPDGSSNSLSGNVQDAETGEPVPFAYLHLEEIHRTAVAESDGRFLITNIPNGNYTLTVHRIGYKTKSLPIEIGLGESDEQLSISIDLSPSLLSSQSIEVTADRENVSGSNLEHASRKFLGDDLRRDLGATLGKTLSKLPGISERTNGSAPGRPVIRGLGDERVEILQDGITSGDISAQSSDHAVTIDPASAQEVQIARGPAALEFGSNAIGGVINVVQNSIPSSMPGSAGGTFSLTGESVNRGGATALTMAVPLRSFVFTFDLNGRATGNTRTPSGENSNTNFSNTNDAIGLSWIKDWGYIGGSFNTFLSSYGIPPNPAGHASGVDIEMKKFQYVVKSEVILNKDLFKTISFDYSLNNYNHKEYESEDIIGTEFGLVTQNFDLKAKHASLSFLNRGTIGVNAKFQDYAVSGANTPPSNSNSMGIYLIEESDFGALHLEGGLRYDLVQNIPDQEETDSNIGHIRTRSFSALSSSVSAIYSMTNRLSIGSTVLHSFRAPSLEELYSEGPHLASYSYEVGNPDLSPERGIAKEIFIRYKGNRNVFEITGYHNGFSNYLYARDTGELRAGQSVNIYKFTGTEARLYGFEVYGESQLSTHFVWDAQFSFTIGEQDSAGTYIPLPMIPPLNVSTSLKYSNKDLEIGSRFRYSAKQDRLGEFETVTDAYVLANLFIQYRFNSNKLLHTLSLNVDNVLNTEYYNHLSRIKELRPEAGRNIRILYRLYF